MHHITNNSLNTLVARTFTILALLLSNLAFSQTTTEDEGEYLTAEEFYQSLNPTKGTITLPGGKVAMQLGDEFEYLNPENAETLLVDGWGNPPGNKSLGMIIPAGVNPLTQEGWGVIITYNADGYVSDADADDIDYNDLLKDMQKETESYNKQRIEMVYSAMHLVGWAESPTYDKSTHKFYWAKELATSGTDENALNYNIRVLGRKGVLVLNAVAGMNQIQEVKTTMPSLLAVTDFTKGNRYEDFNSATDHVAEYGLAALVAGGVASKLGFFAKIGAFLFAFKKFIIIGVIAIGALIGRIFSGRKSQQD